jgi:hypothetical protein
MTAGQKKWIWVAIAALIVIAIGKGSDNGRDAMIKLLGTVGVVAIVIWVISTGVRSGISQSHKLSPSSPTPHASSANHDDSGRYRVWGVDRQTKMDTSWVGSAESQANAKVKAELEGIIVTSIRRESHSGNDSEA